MDANPAEEYSQQTGSHLPLVPSARAAGQGNSAFRAQLLIRLGRDSAVLTEILLCEGRYPATRTSNGLRMYLFSYSACASPFFADRTMVGLTRVNEQKITTLQRPEQRDCTASHTGSRNLGPLVGTFPPARPGANFRVAGALLESSVSCALNIRFPFIGCADDNASRQAIQEINRTCRQFPGGPIPHVPGTGCGSRSSRVDPPGSRFDLSVLRNGSQTDKQEESGHQRFCEERGFGGKPPPF